MSSFRPSISRGTLASFLIRAGGQLDLQNLPIVPTL
jgi:hypothetical protein